MNRLTNAIEAPMDRIAAISYGIAGVALIGILVLMVLRIVSRNLTLEIAGLQLYAQALGVWMVFIVAGALGWERRHIEMDYMSSRLPTRLKPIHNISVALLTIAMCGVLVVGAIQATDHFWTGTSPSVDIPLPLYYVPAIIGLSMFVVVQLDRVATEISQLRE